MIEVILYPPFVPPGGVKKLTIPYFDKMTIEDLLQVLCARFPELSIHFSPSGGRHGVMASVGGHKVGWDHPLTAGDEVTLLSMFGGG